MLTAGAGISIGIWIKWLAVHPHRFTLVVIGQTIEAAAQVLTFGLAGSITAAWFGAHEIAFSGSLALFGDQVRKNSQVIAQKVRKSSVFRNFRNCAPF